MDADIRQDSFRPRLWFALYTATGVAAAMVLVAGWMFGLEPLVRIRDGLPAMVPSTAICFLLLALAHVGSLIDMPRARQAAKWAARAVVVLAGVNMLLRGLSLPQGVDAYLPAALGSSDAMAYATGGLMMLAAACARCNDIRPGATLPMATLGFSTALGLVILLIIDPTLPETVTVLSSISAPTAVLFALLFGSSILARL